jgi:hypothetical protein
MTLNITGEFSDISLLTERDTELLEQEIAELFPSNVRVVVAAIDHSSPSSFVVELKVTAIAENLGYQGSSDDQVEAMMSEVPNMVNKFLDSGLLVTKLMDNLDKVAQSETDPLRRTEKISLLSVDLLDIHFQNPNAGGAFAIPFVKDDASVQIVSSYVPNTAGGDMAFTESVGVISLLAVISIVVVIAVVATRSGDSSPDGIFSDIRSTMFGSNTHALLPAESEHARLDSDNVISGGVRSHRKIDDSDFDKQQTVHYEDDLDIYGKYMDKKTML